MTIATSPPLSPEGFRHEALLYDGDTSFLKGTVPFIESGLAGDEAVMVVVSARKIELLKEALSQQGSGVAFADMDNVGLNPARIIPAWRAFVEENSRQGRPMRGIGEPIWPDRGAAELAECHHHEALLNVAFTDAKQFWLLCPYDTAALGPGVIERMAVNHPFLSDGERVSESEAYNYEQVVSQPFLEPLPDPPPEATALSFTASTLRQLRAWVSSRATDAGMSKARTDDLVLAVNEIASNSVRHGGGSGDIRLWEDDRAITCDVFDTGHIRHPLAGRQLPVRGQDSGRGLWIANQVCDLVQIRSSPEGTVVRLRQSKTGPSAANPQAIQLAI